MANVRGYTSKKVEEELQEFKSRLYANLNVIHSSIASLIGYAAAEKKDYLSHDSQIVKDIFGRLEMLSVDADKTLDYAIKETSKLITSKRNLESIHYKTLDNLKEMAAELKGYRQMVGADLEESFGEDKETSQPESTEDGVPTKDRTSQQESTANGGPTKNGKDDDEKGEQKGAGGQS